jgi:hypothetical protein
LTISPAFDRHAFESDSRRRLAEGSAAGDYKNIQYPHPASDIDA